LAHFSVSSAMNLPNSAGELGGKTDAPQRDHDWFSDNTGPYSRRSPPPLSPPWLADKMPGGYVVGDANGRALVPIHKTSRWHFRPMPLRSSWLSGRTGCGRQRHRRR
jgi:hypothetical protein